MDTRPPLAHLQGGMEVNETEEVEALVPSHPLPTQGTKDVGKG